MGKRWKKRQGKRGERADCAGKKGPGALWEKGILNPSNKSVFPRQNLSFKLSADGIDGAKDGGIF